MAPGIYLIPKTGPCAGRKEASRGRRSGPQQQLRPRRRNTITGATGKLGRQLLRKRRRRRALLRKNLCHLRLQSQNQSQY
jgi:hypothetical protein